MGPTDIVHTIIVLQLCPGMLRLSSRKSPIPVTIVSKAIPMMSELSSRAQMVSVVVPVYRSARMLETLISRLDLAMRTAGIDWELICVDDSSPDDSWEVLCGLSTSYPQLRCIQLMRNFGQHNALMCGFRHVSGNLIVTIDDDLQHQPESP